MTLLSRFLFKQNVFYTFTCLALGSGIYILSDLFDRLDDFLEAELGLGTIIAYFTVKCPMIISQIMPLVFLIAVILQLSIMSRNRELTAIEACGVPFAKIVRFIFLLSIVWCLAQLAFSQVLGVVGEEQAYRIWKEEVRKKLIHKRKMEDVWFKESGVVVKIDELWPHQERGKGISIYMLQDDALAWKEIIRAEEFTPASGEWILYEAEILSPQDFSFRVEPTLTLPLEQDVKAFINIDPRAEPTQLPLWRLSEVIDRLERSGSNVEGLKVAWHMKVAYAFSLAVMALMGLAIVSVKDNIYLNIALGVLTAFVYYGLFILGSSFGEKGLAPPFMGAWASNILFTVIALTRLSWVTRRVS